MTSIEPPPPPRIVVGIDVAQIPKHFHVGILDIDRNVFMSVYNEPYLSELIKGLAGYSKLLKIAIDAPPRAQIHGERTRLAERELHQMGYRVQWTRRAPMAAPEWMNAGERLWKALEDNFGKDLLIETFPTVASDHLSEDEHYLPLRMFSGKEKRKDYKDYIDACICAIVAEKALCGKAQVVGVGDELGPIYF